ncbi:MAG TPA: hypothetical protein VFA55_10160 [Candidatus Kapabacteria bacterium]|nr:hypothetical protein [Candidatus Kapabacteria bacterium]
MNISKPRCFLVYALAPPELQPSEANRAFNDYIADPVRGLVLYHDHFIGTPGGMAIFFVENYDQRNALAALDSLPGWRIEVKPLIFAYNPAAFDEQIGYTLQAYRQADWETLKQEKRPSYGDPQQEAETAREEQ